MTLSEVIQPWKEEHTRFRLRRLDFRRGNIFGSSNRSNMHSSHKTQEEVPEEVPVTYRVIPRHTVTPSQSKRKRGREALTTEPPSFRGYSTEGRIRLLQ